MVPVLSCQNPTIVFFFKAFKKFLSYQGVPESPFSSPAPVFKCCNFSKIQSPASWFYATHTPSGCPDPYFQVQSLPLGDKAQSLSWGSLLPTDCLSSFLPGLSCHRTVNSNSTCPTFPCRFLILDHQAIQPMIGVSGNCTTIHSFNVQGAALEC